MSPPAAFIGTPSIHNFALGRLAPPKRWQQKGIGTSLHASHSTINPAGVVRGVLVVGAAVILSQGSFPLGSMGGHGVAYAASGAATPPPQMIQNRALHYGNYCGPGPKEVCSEKGCTQPQNLQPVDEVDASCLIHDMSYCKCQQGLFERGGPKIPMIHQLMAVRGLLPQPASDRLLSIDNEYSACIHRADERLFHEFRERVDQDTLPKWWDDTSLAPLGAEGVAGYRKACAVGVGGTCVGLSKDVFVKFVDIFEGDLRVDGEHDARIAQRDAAEVASGGGRVMMGLRWMLSMMSL
mmetsp:Transcript_710/g.1470  ORF Transcript_710/g.1470 Transcript_710/m.1470 type:complete len:295 (+) Transcript_710:46-930(+)|eukprot:CAMPEP_0173391460 /NCGR_PEP_ID=MMETSP1356-20130122/18392_1 /TAXON_ID=77927 ORGANISM="Hemiselmis virescens, Strain PCC157" /NCGR_SAMPLE_ID=MMETSP1356 /ASSEMBLY_ACC=CAM_ASM_000847 /LENGTH=294 /DNA_ID=CAMNT_0014349093 /DNA_START=46 /DNA_END=930 /DNA_ORIENTATION=+